jgi:hypothetical protein
MKAQKQVFKEGVAANAINIIVENLPNIMFVSALAIRACIGILLWMHAVSLFGYIKEPKIKLLIATVFVVAVEVIFTSFSLASAKLRREGNLLVEAKRGDQGKRLLNWANTFFAVTLLGSFGFNAIVLYWTQIGGETTYFHAIREGWQLNIFVQVMNVIAVFTSEGSAFILNSNVETNSPVTQKTNRVTPTIDATNSFEEDYLDQVTRLKVA